MACRGWCTLLRHQAGLPKVSSPETPKSRVCDQPVHNILIHFPSALYHFIAPLTLSCNHARAFASYYFPLRSHQDISDPTRHPSQRSPRQPHCSRHFTTSRYPNSSVIMAQDPRALLQKVCLEPQQAAIAPSSLPLPRLSSSNTGSNGHAGPESAPGRRQRLQLLWRTGREVPECRRYVHPGGKRLQDAEAEYAVLRRRLRARC